MPAKLYFYYSAMNAGKSTTLLQSSYNYNERGMKTHLFIPKLIGKAKIASRIGLEAPAFQFDPDFDFFNYFKAQQETWRSDAQQEPEMGVCAEPTGCILVDEAQFLNREQVRQLAKICDQLSVPVLCYGLRSDFQGEPFEGSKYLLTLADVITEIKTICSCGRKATMNARVGADGRVVCEGEQVQVGGNESYVGKCRKHYQEEMDAAEARLSNSTTNSAAGSEPTTPEKTENTRDAAANTSATSPEKTEGKKVGTDEALASGEELLCKADANAVTHTAACDRFVPPERQ